jgi:hypothetical protein
MAQGLPGQPTFIDITLVQLPDGTALPTPNPAKVLSDPGGAGLPARYQYTFYLNAGPTGATGSPSFAGATDLAATPALGVLTDKFTLMYRSSDGKFVLVQQKAGDSTASATIAGTAFTNANPRTLSTIAIAPQPWDYRVRCTAQTVVTGSIDTRVDLFARIGDPSSGAQVGYGKGLTGVNAIGIPTSLLTGSPAGAAVPGAYGKVAGGFGVNVYLVAVQQAGSSNPWSTPATPDTWFQVEVQPLP